MITFLSYNQIWELLLGSRFNDEIIRRKWVVISRGGMSIGHILSSLYNKRVEFVDPTNGTSSFKHDVNSNEQYLFIDDIISTGARYNRAREITRVPKERAIIFCLIWDTNYIKPDLYSISTNKYTFFPWDLFDTTDLIAFDLDGTIMPEMTFHWFDKWGFKYLNATWSNLRTRFFKPYFIPQGRFMIITARPEIDRKHTEAWLKKYNINPLKLIMAPGEYLGNHKEICYWKEKILKEEKIGIYFENNPHIRDHLKKTTQTFIWEPNMGENERWH